MGLLDRMDRHNQRTADEGRAYRQQPAWAWPVGLAALVGGWVLADLIGAWGIVAMLAVAFLATAVGWVRR